MKIVCMICQKFLYQIDEPVSDELQKLIGDDEPVSHSLCPECGEKYVQEIEREIEAAK